MPRSQRLQGRLALITGSAKRLGRVVAQRLALEGADIAVHYGTSTDEAHQLVGELVSQGRRAAAFQAELMNVQAIEKLVADVVSHFGHLDLLINSAATFVETKFGETSEPTWDTSLGTNLKAPFFCSQFAAPHLAKSGHGAIVNFADLGGLIGWREFLPHSLAKGGVILMTRILAKELAPAVRVNAIAPGTITMPGDPPEWEANYIRQTPLGRTGRPEEIADAVMYLLTAEFLTGHTLVLDGGRALSS